MRKIYLEWSKSDSERVDREVQKSLKDFMKSVKFKSKEEVERLYQEARNFVVKGKFQDALDKIRAAVTTNWEKKSLKESMSELRRISDELNMSQEFNHWDRKQTRNGYIILSLAILIILSLILYRKLN
ncbi:MAG: hypothetical protein ACKO5Y_02920 [Bacteroidota bacterium]